VVEILFLAALCLALTGVIQVPSAVLRLGNIARFVPYPVVAGLMTGLAISLVIYELPEVLGTHGGAKACRRARRDAHHGINGWTLLVALVRCGIRDVAAVAVVREAERACRGTVAGIAITLLIHGDVAARAVLGKIPLPDALLPVSPSMASGSPFVSADDLLITAPALAVVGSARQPARGGRRGRWSARHCAHPNAC